MRISLFAVGKLKSGPESELVKRYLDRFAKAGPAVGLEFSKVTEVSESRASNAKERKLDEAQLLEKAISTNAKLIILDEQGTAISSEQFSSLLADLRDNGERDVIFAIGGADGHDETSRRKAYKMLSFGKMTWPHQMARFMLSEQLYRSVTILSGHPYHRV
jgi:23S rRNA (pseudouridine1915-N3)-methyltransferase